MRSRKFVFTEFRLSRRRLYFKYTKKHKTLRNDVCAQQGSRICVSTMLDRQVLTLYIVYSYAKHDNF